LMREILFGGNISMVICPELDKILIKNNYSGSTNNSKLSTKKIGSHEN